MSLQSDTPPAEVNTPPWSLLSEREREVASMLACAYNHHEIAKALGIGVKTVDTHRLRLLKKLELANNVALTRFMIRRGIVQP